MSSDFECCLFRVASYHFDVERYARRLMGRKIPREKIDVKRGGIGWKAPFGGRSRVGPIRDEGGYFQANRKFLAAGYLPSGRNQSRTVASGRNSVCVAVGKAMNP